MHRLFQNKKALLITLAIFISIPSALGFIYLMNNMTETAESDPFAELTELEKDEVVAVAIPEQTVSILNEDYYSLTFDVVRKVVVTNNGEVSMAEFLNISETDLDRLISEKLLDNFLGFHLLGDVTTENNIIKVSNPYSTDTLIVKMEDITSLDKYENISSVKQLTSDYYLITYDTAMQTKVGYQELRKDATIAGVTTDLEVELKDISIENIAVSDGEIPTQSSINPVLLDETNSVFSVQSVPSEYEAWGVSSIGADHYTEKLILSSNNEPVYVAVLDTGVNITHEVFTDQETGDRLDLTHAYDYINSDDDPADDKGHGTEVAGIIAEATPANVKIIPLKVMDNTGHGSFSTIMEAVVDIDKYVDIVNLSVGVVETPEIAEAIAYFNEMLAEVDAIIIAASGNEGNSASDFPASSPSAWSIGAVNSSGEVASFSNHDDKVDFTAPGVALKLPWYTSDNAYKATDSGTSFACPFAVAATALILAEHPSYTKSEVYNTLVDNADDLGEAGKDIYYGNGSINFNSNMFNVPVFALIETSQIWSNTANNTTIGAVSSSTINSAAITEDTTEPATWLSLDSSTDYVYFNFDLTKNGTYYLWLKDASGHTSYTKLVVDHIDNTVPEIVENLSTLTLGQTHATVAVKFKEEDSGLAQIDWKIKPSGAADTEISTETETLGDESNGLSGATILRSHTFSTLAIDTEYEVTATAQDFVGHTVTTPTLLISTSSSGEDANSTILSAYVDSVMSISLLSSSDLETAVDSLYLSLTPGGGLATTSVIARTSSNDKLKLTMSMTGDETALVQADGSRIEGTTSNDIATNHWGYSVGNSSSYSMVPSITAPAILSHLPYNAGTQDTTINFGAKAGSSLPAGDYVGSIVLTVVADD